MSNNHLKNKRIIIISIVVWLMIMLVIIGFFIFTIGKVRVEVHYAPFAATVKLDDTIIMNNNANYITPGEYRLTIEYENFKRLETTVIVDENRDNLFGILAVANEEGERYIQEHSEEFSLVDVYASAATMREGEKQRAKFPIITQLPIKNPYYTIGYNIDGDKLEILVESSIDYRQLAVNGVLTVLEDEDFGRYDVVFLNLDNPFEGKFVASNVESPVEFLQNGFMDAGIKFDVGAGQIEGDYYYGFLRYYSSEYVSVIYRVVLVGNDEGWKLVADPYPLLTTTNTPGVPLEIINKVNNL